MTDSKEGKLYRWLNGYQRITNWDAVSMWRLLDFRKAMTRMRRRFRREGKEVISQNRYRLEGKRIIRYKEHFVSKSPYSAKKRAK